ncbi:glutathione S-transferase family protein [Roseovarius spongiae]|uniref:Glutathione S-transferase family protein n=1 Tax=Roseovarius spongiae TaxID=2320272 RepID=A0A3A8B2B0_9RHOB|nr:glutathione S-transferase family protein [Roseovarius spongiae]RKF13463.1 glutathione S-transferase family protein [Roseovarius spongiae]
MELYYAPNTISIASAIALHEADAKFTLRAVDFKAGEQTKPVYHAINPKGRVPVLDLGETRLTETGAILEYIAATHPDAGLMPDDPIDAAHVRMVMYYLASTMHVNHAHKMRGARWADKEDSLADMKAKVPETMTASAQYVEENCLRGVYTLGDRISIVDPYLYILCNWLVGDRVDIAPFERIRAFLEAMNARASVKAVRDAGMLS